MPGGVSAAEFGSLDGAVGAAAAVLREVTGGNGTSARMAVCFPPTIDGQVDLEAVYADAIALLRSSPRGSLTFAPGVASQLDGDPGPTLRAPGPLASADGDVPQVLDEVGRQREVRIGGIRFLGRRRRPSGERAPLPRELRLSGRLAVVASLIVVATWVSLFVFPDAVVWWQRWDDLLLDRLVAARTDLRTTLAQAIAALGSPWFWRTLRFGVLLLLVVLRRWRHLLVALLVFLVLDAVVSTMMVAVARPRPMVPVLLPWQGFAHPSSPVANLASTLVVLGFVLLRRGAARQTWMLAGGAAVTALIAARAYLGADHLSDGFVGAVLGVAIPLVAFRTLAPERVFPVTYRRGRAAHLDIDRRRDRAIRQAMRDQLGIEVVAIEPFGLEASGGSTPLRITVAGDGNRYLFAKLYSTSHLRADRWYKAARTILYGSLEDELRHPSVRRLVEREDYLLLTMRKAGIPCARTYGVVEITPEREYLTVSEFLHGAIEISEAEVDDQVIDEGLAAIRRMWDAGLAHRDIKPGNVLVQDGHVRIVDVAFAMVRPSPWRQAVDLANMMLILGLRSSPEHVYQRALRFFAPEDIAEAFAATRSVTIPSESRSSLRLLSRSQGIDLVKRFGELSPHREPITIQRWSRRRIMLTLGAVLMVILLVPLVAQNLLGGGFL